jgi:hypothetical protein
MEEMPDVRIVRKRQVLWDKNTDYYVVMDDQVVGTLQANQSFTYSASLGLHRIQVTARSEYRASNVVEVNLEPAHTAELVCSIRAYSAFFQPQQFKKMHRIKLRAIEPLDENSSDP